jgi:hypothetical protein
VVLSVPGMTPIFGRFALISTVGRPSLEMLHHIAPDGLDTRLGLTYRWPTSIPDRQAVATSMADAVRHKVQAFKDVIENPDSPWAGRR